MFQLKYILQISVDMNTLYKRPWALARRSWWDGRLGMFHSNSLVPRCSKQSFFMFPQSPLSPASWRPLQVNCGQIGICYKFKTNTASAIQSLAMFCYDCWLKFRGSVWAVANHRCGKPAMGTFQNMNFKTWRLTGWRSLYKNHILPGFLTHSCMLP